MADNARIVGVDRLLDGVVVFFDDGRTVLYSSALLHDLVNDGQDITKLPNPDEDS